MSIATLIIDAGIAVCSIGVAWLLFGRPYDVRVNGLLVPSWAQAMLRLCAPLPWFSILMIERSQRYHSRFVARARTHGFPPHIEQEQRG